MKTNRILITLILLGAPLLAGCGSRARVGELRTESQSVELGDDRPVRVQIEFAAGDLDLRGGAAKLLEADFTYNVAKLKPEVRYADGKLVVRQPDARGLPVLRGITDFRNEWDLHLYDEVPIDLTVDMGAGTSRLRLASLLLTRLDVTLGAGASTIDLNGDWMRDLDVSIDAGAADVILRLPKEVGTRVEVDGGLTLIEAPDLTQNGNVYTNDAYGVSAVTLRVNLSSGLGHVTLEVEEAETAGAVGPGVE